MKVYQIFKATGWGDDYYRYAIKTYLHKSKAEAELERLKSEVPNCDECPYMDWIAKQVQVDCPHFELEIAEYDDEDLTYTCKNTVDSYDAPSYSIEEFDVDESEDTGNE